MYVKSDDVVICIECYVIFVECCVLYVFYCRCWFLGLFVEFSKILLMKGGLI